MQWELAALANGAREQAQAGPEEEGLPQQARLEQWAGVLSGSLEQVAQAERARGAPGDDDADQEADVADARGDERLFGGDPRLWLVVPEADQQVATQAH